MSDMRAAPSPAKINVLVLVTFYKVSIRGMIEAVTNQESGKQILESFAGFSLLPRFFDYEEIQLGKDSIGTSKCQTHDTTQPPERPHSQPQSRKCALNNFWTKSAGLLG